MLRKKFFIYSLILIVVLVAEVLVLKYLPSNSGTFKIIVGALAIVEATMGLLIIQYKKNHFFF
ncbi:MAG: hypothetical protein AAGJ18_05695, partial [Bacteroidota bacterium]